MSHRMLLAAALIVAVVPLMAPASGPKHKARAQLHSMSVAHGTATYQDQIRNGKRDQRFNVHATRQQPLKLLTVRVNGRPAGVMLTNPIGSGRLRLRTGGHGPADPLPANFPRLRTGDIVTAGNMVGIVFQTDGGSYQATGEATADDGMNASVVYEEQNAGAGSPIERHFEVTVTGGPAEQAIPIFVHDVFIDTVFTDPAGNGTFEMSTPGLNDGDDAPIPDDLPSLVGGDVVNVGNAAVTLVQSSPPGGGAGDDDSSDDGSSADGDSGSDDDSGSGDDDSDDHGSGDDGSGGDGGSGGDDD